MTISPNFRKQIYSVCNHQLSRNVIWSLLGTSAPLLVAVIAIPILVDGLGVARFGILTLAWMVVGYFGLFDMGIGRALIKFVAERLGTKEESEIPSFIWTAIVLMMALGGIGGLVGFALSPWLVIEALNIPLELQVETLDAFYYLAASLPLVIVSIGFRGVLEAYQHFGIINIIRVPLGSLTFLAPLAVLPYSQSLADIVLALVYVRVIACVVYIVVCMKMYPNLRLRAKLDAKKAMLLFKFGGWMTVSSIAGPILLYLGRVMIIVMISAEAVAYFSTPYEVVIKILIIPGAVVSVLFPVFANRMSAGNDGVKSIYVKAQLSILLLVFPCSLMSYLFAEDVLAWWINEQFSLNGYRVAQLLAVGVLINSLGHLSQSIIQAYGRPDLTAKLHLAELFLYIPYLWFLTKLYGVEGAAYAWVIRVSISTILLLIMSNMILNRYSAMNRA